MSKWVNSYTSSEARRWLESLAVNKQGCSNSKRWRDFPQGHRAVTCSEQGPILTPVTLSRCSWPSTGAGCPLTAEKQAPLLWHAVVERSCRPGVAQVCCPPSRQAPTPLSAQIASPWMIMECKHGDSRLGVEEDIGRRVDGERTVQAAKFNLREFGSVLSISNTLKKNRIPRTKEKGKVGEHFHPVQSMESKSIILCSLPGPSNASKNTKGPGPWAAGHPQGGGGERDKDQDKKQPPRLSTAQAMFHRPKKPLQVRNVSTRFGHLILTKTSWSRCYWNSYFTNKKQNENDEVTGWIFWKSGWNLNPGPLSPIGQT